jgi:hypothetical protein
MTRRFRSASSIGALVGCFINLLGGATTSAQEHKAPAYHKCKRAGSVVIEIDQSRFSVPRTILRMITLSNGQVDQRWECEDRKFAARDFYISVSRTRAGDAYYENWFRERRLPTHIEIVRRGRIKKFTSDHLKTSEQMEKSATRRHSGFRVVANGPNEYFDASELGLLGWDQRPVVFQCINIKLLTGGRSCRASYALSDAIDVHYKFDDNDFSPAEWVELDRRLREFVKELMVHSQGR